MISGKNYDVVFIGHICYDEVIHGDHAPVVNVGGAAIYGVVAAARAGKKVAAVLMLSEKDQKDIMFLKSEGIDVFSIDAKETTRVQVIHASSNMDDRRVITQKFAGLFEDDMIPPVNGKFIHLAGCNDHEFPLEFIQAMKKRGYSLSIDMQYLVRHNDPKTGEIMFKNDDSKKDVVKLMDRIKLDILEAKLLTGTDDLEKATTIVQSWGCPEVVITCSDGVWVRTPDIVCFEKFSNRSVIGRTGRGDTTFGAYLAWRVDHGAQESLKFAAALVSIKMEKPGVFSGTLKDVFERMKCCDMEMDRV